MLFILMFKCLNNSVNLTRGIAVQFPKEKYFVKVVICILIQVIDVS